MSQVSSEAFVGLEFDFGFVADAVAVAVAAMVGREAQNRLEISVRHCRRRRSISFGERAF